MTRLLGLNGITGRVKGSRTSSVHCCSGHLEKWNGIPRPDAEVKKSAFPSGPAGPSSDLYQSKCLVRGAALSLKPAVLRFPQPFLLVSFFTLNHRFPSSLSIWLHLASSVCYRHSAFQDLSFLCLSPRALPFGCQTDSERGSVLLSFSFYSELQF